MTNIKVFIVDDHNILIEGLINMIKGVSSIELVGSALCASDCLLFVKNNAVDVILMDINLGNESGLDLCKTINQKYEQIKVVAISSYTQGSFIENMLLNGAKGYLYKNSKKDEILASIQEAYQGKIYLSSEAKINYNRYISQKSHRPMITRRELEILQLICKGLRNTDISKMLFISIDTVDTHRKNLYAKLSVNNTAQLIQKALELQLIC